MRYPVCVILTNTMLFWIIISIALGDQLTWYDKYHDVTYDWSSLQRPAEDPWVIKGEGDAIFRIKYKFNFGRSLLVSCTPNDPVAAIECDEIDDDKFETCSVVGRHEMTTLHNINLMRPKEGVKITYHGGDACPGGGFDMRRQIIFRIKCSDVEGDWELQPEDANDFCSVYLDKNSKAGCPIKGTPAVNRLKIGLIVIAGLVLAYVVIGVLVNYRRGETGADLIPNKEFWSSLPSVCRDACKMTVGQFKPLAASARKDYEMIQNS